MFCQFPAPFCLFLVCTRRGGLQTDSDGRPAQDIWLTPGQVKPPRATVSPSLSLQWPKRVPCLEPDPVLVSDIHANPFCLVRWSDDLIAVALSVDFSSQCLNKYRLSPEEKQFKVKIGFSTAQRNCYMCSNHASQAMNVHLEHKNSGQQSVHVKERCG